jgi:hypothetical protein
MRHTVHLSQRAEQIERSSEWRCSQGGVSALGKAEGRRERFLAEVLDYYSIHEFYVVTD